MINRYILISHHYIFLHVKQFDIFSAKLRALAPDDRPPNVHASDAVSREGNQVQKLMQRSINKNKKM